VLAVCEFSAYYCLLHYLADRARHALGRTTISNARLLQAVFERQGGICPYTGRTLTYGTAEIDHVLPRAKGGTDCVDNVEWVHPDVNRAKAALGRDEFLMLCLAVIEHTGLAETQNGRGEWVSRAVSMGTGVPFVEAPTAGASPGISAL